MGAGVGAGVGTGSMGSSSGTMITSSAKLGMSKGSSSAGLDPKRIDSALVSGGVWTVKVRKS